MHVKGKHAPTCWCPSRWHFQGPTSCPLSQAQISATGQRAVTVKHHLPPSLTVPISSRASSRAFSLSAHKRYKWGRGWPTGAGMELKDKCPDLPSMGRTALGGARDGTFHLPHLPLAQGGILDCGRSRRSIFFPLLLSAPSFPPMGSLPSKAPDPSLRLSLCAPKRMQTVMKQVARAPFLPSHLHGTTTLWDGLYHLFDEIQRGYATFPRSRGCYIVAGNQESRLLTPQRVLFLLTSSCLKSMKSTEDWGPWSDIGTEGTLGGCGRESAVWDGEKVARVS